MAIKQQNSLKATLAASLSPYYRVLSPIMKLNQLIIAACAAIATSIAVAAPSLAYEARIVGQDRGSAVNMRSGPGKGYQVVDQTAVGKGVNIISSEQGSDGQWWFKVRSGSGSDETIGWVRGDYVRRNECGG